MPCERPGKKLKNRRAAPNYGGAMDSKRHGAASPATMPRNLVATWVAVAAFAGLVRRHRSFPGRNIDSSVRHIATSIA